MGFANDIIGGAATLIRSAIQSANFVSGTSGWQISKNGNAQFSNLTIRGTFNGTDYVINSSGAFFYSGTPAAGNLIVSIAPASGTDSFGNAYPEGISLGISSEPQVQSNFQTSGASLVFPLNDSGFEGVPDAASVGGQVVGSGGTRYASLTLAGPSAALSGSTDYVEVALNSDNAGGTSTANMDFYYIAAGGGSTLTASFNGSSWTFGVPVTIEGNLTVSGASTVTMSGAAVSAQSFTSSGDMSVEGTDLFVGNGSTASITLDPQQAVNAAATHIGTAPTEAEFNSVVDLINSIRTALINIGLCS